MLEFIYENLYNGEKWEETVKVKNLIKIPDIFELERILIFEPHPDDLEIFMGGTAKKLADRGKDITLITVTDGRKGTYNPSMDEERLKVIRLEERKKAGEFLGIKNILMLNHRDLKLPDEKELTKEFLKLIRELKPDIVFTPDPWLPYEVHPDHIKVGISVARASFLSPLPLVFKEIPPFKLKWIAFYITGKPNTYIDITEVFEEKLKAIEIHRSQFPTEESLNFIKMYLSIKNGEYGGRAGGKFGEAFKVISPDYLHTNVDALDL